MKQTLRERMENMLCRIVGRVEMLQKSINEYKEAGDFENAGCLCVPMLRQLACSDCYLPFFLSVTHKFDL